VSHDAVVNFEPVIGEPRSTLLGRDGTGVVLHLARPYGPHGPWTHETLRLARKGWQPFEGPDPAFVPTASLIDATTAVVAALEAHPASTTSLIRFRTPTSS
jgi:hypothetical protein